MKPFFEPDERRRLGVSFPGFDMVKAKGMRCGVDRKSFGILMTMRRGDYFVWHALRKFMYKISSDFGKERKQALTEDSCCGSLSRRKVVSKYISEFQRE
jgi:hypothetical protein